MGKTLKFNLQHIRQQNNEYKLDREITEFKKNKELMAIAISICIRCEDCIAYHMQNAIKAQASREEVIESINVAIEMGGGPSTVYGGKAIAAYEEFTRG
jgi:AhpD family alkylhydroperoxidase